MGFMQTIYGGNGTVQVDSGLPRIGEIYGIEQNGDLRWYRYDGQGVSNPEGNQGWHPNSRSIIGNGWNGFRHVVAGGDGVLFGVEQNGNLRWYQYEGHGEYNPDGNMGWHSNSRNVVGNGWNSFLFVTSRPLEGRIGPAFPNDSAIYGIEQNGDLRWYRYLGHGEENPGGTQAWHANSGNTIGNGWQSFRHVVGVSRPFLLSHKREIFGGTGMMAMASMTRRAVKVGTTTRAMLLAMDGNPLCISLGDLVTKETAVWSSMLLSQTAICGGTNMPEPANRILRATKDGIRIPETRSDTTGSPERRMFQTVVV